MKYIIKRKINLFNQETNLKYCYSVKINKTKNGFENFDIKNEEIIIDKLINDLEDTKNYIQFA